MEEKRLDAGRSGGSGANGGGRAAAHFSPGVFALGEVYPNGGQRANWLREAGRREVPAARN